MQSDATYEPVIVTPDEVREARERVFKDTQARPARSVKELMGPGKDASDPEDVDRFLAILDEERRGVPLRWV